jgi:hypothetical protein
MSSEPSIPDPSRRQPVLTRRGWECLPLIRTNYVALSAGLHPGEYRRPDDSYERYLARCGVDAAGVAEDRWTIVECIDGLTLRLEVDRTRRHSWDRPPSAAAIRSAIERLVETTLAVGPPG